MQSTLFNALSENAKAQAANFPFCTIEPNIGLVAVPDPRLEVSCSIVTGAASPLSTSAHGACMIVRALILLQVLSTISNSEKIIPTSVEFVDIAGLVKGASKGRGWATNSWPPSGNATPLPRCAMVHQMVCYPESNGCRLT